MEQRSIRWMDRWSCTGGAELLSSRRSQPGYGEHGDVVFLAERLRGSCDAVGGLRADIAGAIEAVELARGVRRFYYTIGKQSQRFAGRKCELSLGVFNVGGDSEGKAGVGGNFFTAPIRRKVAGVGHGDGAVGGDSCAETSDEAAVLCIENLLVEARKQRCGTEIFGSQRSQRADGESPGHGGFQALAADVADDDECRAIRLFEDLVEIAANLLCGEIGGLHAISREFGERCGYEALLNFARSGEFCCGTSLFAADACEAE